MNKKPKLYSSVRLLIFFSVLGFIIIIDACRKIDRQLEKPKEETAP